MRPEVIQICWWVAMVTLLCQPVQAGGRRAAEHSDARAEYLLDSKQPAVSMRSARASTSTEKPLQGRRLVLGGRQDDRDDGSQENGKGRKYKKLTLLHFNSRVGEVRVEPVFGHVNGAQFSIGF